MGNHRSEWRGSLKVALAAAFVAVAGQAVILSDDFGGGNSSQASDNARMITAAAVSSAGATETWPARRPHLTWPAFLMAGSNSSTRGLETPKAATPQVKRGQPAYPSSQSLR